VKSALQPLATAAQLLSVPENDSVLFSVARETRVAEIADRRLDPHASRDSYLVQGERFARNVTSRGCSVIGSQFQKAR
jgi:hypothetical protein